MAHRRSSDEGPMRTRARDSEVERAFHRTRIDAAAWAWGRGPEIHCARTVARESARGRPLTPDGGLFDLASLTKPLVTTPLVLAALDDGVMTLRTAITELVPELRHDPELSAITVDHLLRHTSGLPADVPRGRLREQSEGAVWSLLLACRPGRPPGADVTYSDVGFAWLAAALTACRGTDLTSLALGHFDSSTIRRVDLTMSPAPPEAAWPSAPPDEGRRTGEVHDELAAATRSGTGNAGAFGTLGGAVQAIGHWVRLARRGSPLPLFHDPAGSPRGLGWALAGDAHHFLGRPWPETTATHLGYTGTAVALDPSTQAWAVLLTNALTLGRDKPGWRPLRTTFFEQAGLSLARSGDLNSIRT